MESKKKVDFTEYQRVVEKLVFAEEEMKQAKKERRKSEREQSKLLKENTELKKELSDLQHEKERLESRIKSLEKTGHKDTSNDFENLFNEFAKKQSTYTIKIPLPVDDSHVRTLFGTEQETRKAFKILRGALHPDLGGDEGLFKKVNEVYEQEFK